MGRLRPSSCTRTARGSISPAGDTHMRPLPSTCPPPKGSACASPNPLPLMHTFPAEKQGASANKLHVKAADQSKAQTNVSAVLSICTAPASRGLPNTGVKSLPTHIAAPTALFPRSCPNTRS